MPGGCPDRGRDCPAAQAREHLRTGQGGEADVAAQLFYHVQTTPDALARSFDNVAEIASSNTLMMRYVCVVLRTVCALASPIARGRSGFLAGSFYGRV